MNLTFLQQVTLFYWLTFEIATYFQYRKYLEMGLQPKYAFEKADSL